MRNRVIHALLALIALATVLSAPATRPLRAQEKEKPAPLKLKVGDTAPDFTLKYYDGAKLQDVSLKDYRGKKNVVLAFFVFAFTGG
jgi:cytochrome oxidase Cu insertion factor (SCO1/SenC/PrrC family)